PALAQADGPRQAGEPSIRSPAAGGGRIVSPLLISEGLAGRSLPRLRKDALSSTSALAHGAAGPAPPLYPPFYLPPAPPPLAGRLGPPPRVHYRPLQATIASGRVRSALAGGVKIAR